MFQPLKPLWSIHPFWSWEIFIFSFHNHGEDEKRRLLKSRFTTATGAEGCHEKDSGRKLVGGSWYLLTSTLSMPTWITKVCTYGDLVGLLIRIFLALSPIASCRVAKKIDPRLRECSSQCHTEVVSNSRNKILETWDQLFWRPFHGILSPWD